jgi:uncharacterized DUF497 family protein
MADLRFHWDEAKAAANAAKHGVTFLEATWVFSDPLGKVLPDPTNSSGEDRAIMMGHSNQGRLLLVVFTDRADLIRIISAREANRRERREYEEHP